MKKFTFLQSIAAIMGLLIVIGVGCSKVALHDETANEPQYEMMTGEDISLIGERKVMYSFLPDTLNFMICLIEGNQETNPYENDIPCIHHDNTLTYALRCLVPIGIIKPPIDL